MGSRGLLSGRAGDHSPAQRSSRAAIEVWRKGIQLDPDHIELRVALEQVLFRLGRLSEAGVEADYLRAQPGQEALGELMSGQIDARQSNTAGAVRAFTHALAHPEQWSFMVDPNLARNLLARQLLSSGQPAIAPSNCSRAGGRLALPKPPGSSRAVTFRKAVPATPAFWRTRVRPRIAPARAGTGSVGRRGAMRSVPCRNRTRPP